MWKPLAKLIKALSSNYDPGAIAWGFSCGILLGFMPKNNLLWYILTVLILFLRIQRGTYAIAMIIGSLIAPSLDPLFDLVGTAILTWDKGIPVYSYLLNIPFISFTKFHNTIVMGSFACGLMAFAPMYGLARLVIFLWRRFVAAPLKNAKIVQTIKKVPFVEGLRKMIAVVDAID